MIKTLVFLSNYFNHHQKPLSDALYDQLGDGYIFIETQAMDSERESMGWGMENYPEYVVSFACFIAEKERYVKMIQEADAVIIGSAPNELVKKRIDQNKVVFRYSERPLKKGLELWRYPVRYWRWHRWNPRNKKIYMLCSSAYTAGDFAKFGLFRGRCFKFGYFPETKEYDDVDALLLKKNPTSILWVARFIPLKHPEAPIEVARRLKKEGYSFHLKMIGEGSEREALEHLVVDEGLQAEVEFLNFMRPNAVREHMEESEIFLFTSDRNEGWGAVLNESMNAACAVISSREVGAAPFLIRQNQNGMMYRDMDDLYEKVKHLLDRPEQRRAMGREAYNTITQEWCAENAAAKLLGLIDAVLKDERRVDLYQDGVCSLAE